MTSPDRTAPTGLATRLADVEGVVFDVDGCLVLSDSPGGHGGTVLPGAPATLAAARAAGRRVQVFTNASSQTPSDLAASLRDLGLQVGPDDVLTPSVVAAEIIIQRYAERPVLAFGGPGLLDVLSDAGVNLLPTTDDPSPTAPSAVVIGWDTSFDRDSLQRAAEAIWQGAAFLVTSDARRFASRTRPIAGVSGFIAQGLSHVTETPYEVLGKPSAAAMTVACRRLDADPVRVVVVGDDLTLESRMARAAGALAVLVTTGLHTRGDADAAHAADRPDIIVDGLAELSQMWRAADQQRSEGAA